MQVSSANSLASIALHFFAHHTSISPLPFSCPLSSHPVPDPSPRLFYPLHFKVMWNMLLTFFFSFFLPTVLAIILTFLLIWLPLFLPLFFIMILYYSYFNLPFSLLRHSVRHPLLNCGIKSIVWKIQKPLWWKPCTCLSVRPTCFTRTYAAPNAHWNIPTINTSHNFTVFS